MTKKKTAQSEAAMNAALEATGKAFEETCKLCPPIPGHEEFHAAIEFMTKAAGQAYVNTAGIKGVKVTPRFIDAGRATKLDASIREVDGQQRIVLEIQRAPVVVELTIEPAPSRRRPPALKGKGRKGAPVGRPVGMGGGE